MPEISAALARALERGDTPFLLFYADHPSGVARYWSRTGYLNYGGHVWGGLGIMGAISGATRSTNLAINEVTFELRGVPPTTTTQLSGLVRNRVAQVTLGAISRRGRVTIDDDPIIDALMEMQKLAVDPKGRGIIRISGHQGFYVLDRAQDIACSHEQQTADHPGDLGMALMHRFVDRESNWRAVA
jgi:hypothetical protein